MLETSLATTVREDKNLFRILSQVPEDNVCKEHMVLEKGTDTYANRTHVGKKTMKDY